VIVPSPTTWFTEKQRDSRFEGEHHAPIFSFRSRLRPAHRADDTCRARDAEPL